MATWEAPGRPATDDWILFEEDKKEERWDLNYKHKDCSKVEFHTSCIAPSRVSKEGDNFHFFVNLFVEDEFYDFGDEERGNGRKEDFEPFVNETMETLNEGLLEKILAFAENTKISTRWAQTSGADYQCGLCDSRIISDTTNKAYDHFIKDHYSGHMVKSASFQ